MSSTHRDHLACEDHLYRSLRVAMEDPACAVDLDPSRVHCSLDSPLDPLSWIDETGERCSIVFPAFFDLYGDHTALEPYFSLLKDCTDLRLSARDLAKTHATFQLSPLSDLTSHVNIPPYAVKRSDIVMDTLSAIYSTTERKIFEVSESLCEDTHSEPFHRLNNKMDKPVFVVKTRPLFMQYPRSTSYYNWHVLPMDPFSQTNSNMIQSLKDPGAPVDDCMIDCPNIRDGDGRLIFPGEYKKVLKDGTIVLINVSPSLNISDEGDRDYSLLLNSMQMFPITDIFSIS